MRVDRTSTVPKRVVDLTQELTTYDDEDHHRRSDNRKRHGTRGDERQPCPEAHEGSRSA